MPTFSRKSGVEGTMKEDVSGRPAARAGRADARSGDSRAREVMSYRVARAPVEVGVEFEDGDAQV